MLISKFQMGVIAKAIILIIIRLIIGMLERS